MEESSPRLLSFDPKQDPTLPRDAATVIVLREVATLVKITERAVQRIIADLEEEGFIEREKVGRQNHYRILRKRKLRHAVEGHRTIGDLLRIIDDGT